MGREGTACGGHLVDGENRTISYIKVRWRLTGTISYEAELQLRNHGKSDGVPVCCMKSGYASGFATTLVGRTILFREVECMGCGHPRCHVIGKTVELWGGNAAEELKLMQPDRVADRLIALQEQVSILRHSLGNEIDIGFMIGARHACSRARQMSSAVGTCADPTRGSVSVDGRAISLLSGVGGVRSPRQGYKQAAVRLCGALWCRLVCRQQNAQVPDKCRRQTSNKTLRLHFGVFGIFQGVPCTAK